MGEVKRFRQHRCYSVLVVNTEFYKNNRQAVDDFLKEYKSSVQYVNSNVDGAAQLVEDFDIFKAAVAKKAIRSVILH